MAVVWSPDGTAKREDDVEEVINGLEKWPADVAAGKWWEGGRE